MWAEADPREVQAVWAEELRHYEATDIRYAIAELRDNHPEYPPTLWQFVNLCRDGRRRRSAETRKVEHVKNEGPVPSHIMDAIRAHVAKWRA